MIKKENLKQAIDAISERDPEIGYSLNEMLGTGQIDVTPQLENASRTDEFHFLFDKEKVFINKFAYINEGTVPIEQGLLVKYGELVSKQEFLGKEAPFSYWEAARKIRAAGLRFMVTHEVSLAITRIRKRLNSNDENKDGKSVSRNEANISLLEKIRQDTQAVCVPLDTSDPSVLYRGTVDVATPALFACFPFCMDSLMQVAAMNLEFFHVRFLLNCLIKGLERNLFICMADRKILGLIYLVFKERIFYKGLEIKFVATLRGKTDNQRESSTRVFKGVGAFLVSGVWMLWKTRVPEVREILLDSEIGAKGFYEAIGFQPRRLSQYALRTPKGQLVKAILIMANNSRDLGGRVLEEICVVMEKQAKDLRKKAKNEKDEADRKMALASIKECLKPDANPEFGRRVMTVLMKYENKIPESRELIQLANKGF